MLNTKNIDAKEDSWENLSFSALLRAFNSKDHYQIRLAVFDMSFLSKEDQRYLTNTTEFRRSAKHSLIYLTQIGDVASIKSLINMLNISPEELKESVLLYAAQKGLLVLSSYGYFSDAFKLLEIYNISEKILAQNQYQQSAYLGLAAMKNNRVNEQTEIKKICQKYRLPKITEAERQNYHKEYFLMELSDPLIYKGYSPARHNLSDWQDFLSAVDPDGKLLESEEITKAATAGVKKVYAAGQKERAGQLILYFSLWTAPELAEIVAESKQFLAQNVFNYTSAEGLNIDIIRKNISDKNMIVSLPPSFPHKLIKD
jgi:hypothetical protein